MLRNQKIKHKYIYYYSYEKVKLGTNLQNPFNVKGNKSPHQCVMQFKRSAPHGTSKKEAK